MVSLFAAAAADLLADMPAGEAVARALAHMTGQTSMQASPSMLMYAARWCWADCVYTLTPSTALKSNSSSALFCSLLFINCLHVES